MNKKMVEDLPQELWVQIFLRLPVKTILRCLSICKAWELFIRHPSFINAHLQQQRCDLMLVRYIPEDDIPKFNTLNYDFDEEANIYNEDENTIARKIKPEVYSLHLDDESFSVYAEHEPPILCQARENLRVVGSCNGIICITNDQFRICHETYLWNPTIYKCVELPRPMFTSDKIGGFDHELGFGFDEKTNDYKVVRIVDPLDRHTAPLEVEIYSLRTRVWRKTSRLATGLRVRIFERAFHERNSQVYLNGVLHWVGWDREQTCGMVIAFHLGDEVFHCFQVPMDIEHDFFEMKKLRPIVVQGSLSLVQYKEQKCFIWMKKDHELSDSWIKILDINLSNQVERVIGIRSKGELLIEIRGCLYCYDPKATEGKQFNFLEGLDHLNWTLLQEGRRDRRFSVGDNIRNYDPEAAPKELGIRSKIEEYFKFSFHSECYRESLALLGWVEMAKIGEVESKKSRKKATGSRCSTATFG